MTSASEERPDDGEQPTAPTGEGAGEGIGDDRLPEDLQPGEDNPLAEPLPEEDRRDDLDLGVADPTEKLGDGPPGPAGPDGE